MDFQTEKQLADLRSMRQASRHQPAVYSRAKSMWLKRKPSLWQRILNKIRRVSNGQANTKTA